jgi:hypothetical protein
MRKQEPKLEESGLDRVVHSCRYGYQPLPRTTAIGNRFNGLNRQTAKT